MATIGVRRPHTAMGFVSPAPDLVCPDVKLGEDILTTGFKDHLENFYHKASPEDRARCLELLTSIDIGDKVKEQSEYLPVPDPGSFQYQPAGLPTKYPTKHRPRTAMAHIGRPRDPLNAYTTTYKREYTAVPGTSGHTERPQTARHQLDHGLSESLGSTTYHNEYFAKQSKTKQIRTGTSSGNRRNNPHPSEAFMVWRIGNPGQRSHNQTYSQLTDEKMDRVMRGQLASTYQQDYLGIPQGYQVKGAFEETEDWRARVPFTLDSSTRYTFQKPDLQPELKCNTVRYGCNKKKHMAAAGVVPTVSNRQLDVKTRTTYEREYNANNGPLVRNVRDMGRQLGAQSLEQYLPGASYKEKETLHKMISTLKPQPPSNRVSGSKYSYNPRPLVPAATSMNNSTSAY